MQKPSSALPPLPMNTRARGRQGSAKLWARKPSSAPTRASAIIASGRLPAYTAAPASIRQAQATSEPHRPSTPSIMLIALISPTVANTVNGSDSQPRARLSRPKAGPSCSTRTPPSLIMISAATAWVRIRIDQCRSYRSSRMPATINSPAPARKPSSAGLSVGKKNSGLSTSPKKIPRPPVTGVLWP